MYPALPMIRGLIAAILLATIGSPAVAQYSPRVGQPHPAFTLPALEVGRPVSLADYRGQKVLLVQFAAW